MLPLELFGEFVCTMNCNSKSAKIVWQRRCIIAVSQAWGLQKSRDNARVVPRREKTATNRCNRPAFATKRSVPRHPERIPQSRENLKRPVALPQSLFYGISRLGSE